MRYVKEWVCPECGPNTPDCNHDKPVTTTKVDFSHAEIIDTCEALSQRKRQLRIEISNRQNRGVLIGKEHNDKAIAALEAELKRVEEVDERLTNALDRIT